MIWGLWRPRESKSQDQQYGTLSGLRHRMAVASRPTAVSSGRFSHRTKSVASRQTAEPSSRFSRCVGQFGTVRGDFGNREPRNFGEFGKERERKRLARTPRVLQYRATLSASHPRTRGHSFKLPDSGQSLRRLRLEQQQRGGGARGASGPPLAIDSGGDFGHGSVRSCPIREGVWRVERWAETRPRSVPRPEKGVRPQDTHAHKSLRCTTQSTRAYTRACSSHACTYRCFTSSTARRKAQHSAHENTYTHAQLWLTRKTSTSPPPPGSQSEVGSAAASGAWSAGLRRDRAQFPVPKKVCVHRHPRTQEPALHNTELASVHTRVLVTRVHIQVFHVKHGASDENTYAHAQLWLTRKTSTSPTTARVSVW